MTNQVKFEIQTTPGVWVDITNDVYQRDGLSISRGRSDEQSQSQPQTARFTIDNRDGRYSARNPMSPLYGAFGRNTPVRITENSSYQRFYGEIPRVAPVWNENHSDNWIPVEASGIMRRLGQGQAPAKIALQDYILSFGAQLGAYYPLAGGSGVTVDQNLAPGKTGTFRGVPSPGPGPVFTFGTQMAAWIGTGMELNATGTTSYMSGQCSVVTYRVALDFVWSSDAFGVLTPQISDFGNGTWFVNMNTSTSGGTLQTGFTSQDGLSSTLFPVTSAIPAMLAPGLHYFRLQIEMSGADTQYFVYIDGLVVDTGWLFGVGVAGCKETRFSYSRYTGQTVMDLAHVAIWANSVPSYPTVANMTNAALGHVGETAIDRVTRVASDGGIPISTVGTSAESMTMGPQFSEPHLDAIRDAENADMGILYESRTASGLVYASRASLYNKTPAFTLNYAAGQIVAPLEPSDDDQTTRNDVIATRRDGGSAEVSVDTGPMSTQDSPVGIGRYQSEVTVNVQTDGLLTGVAAWVAAIGTLNQARWPSVTVNLNVPGISSALANQIRTADIGDWFVITGMSQAFVYDDVTLVIIGYSESIDPFVHTITFNCMPAEPYTVAVYSTSRYDADSSTLTAGVTSTATSISATKSGATLWTTDATMFPFDIRVGGERMTVTNITGATSPQTMTVTRSKNGVVKAQTAGTAIELWDTPRYAL